jgi:hypothetical protein
MEQGLILQIPEMHTAICSHTFLTVIYAQVRLNSLTGDISAVAT